MAVGPRIEMLNVLFPEDQIIGFPPRYTQMFRVAQEHSDNERARTDATTTQLFHTIGEEMQNRLAGLLKQIEALQTALVQSQGQNQELQLTQNVQVAALEAQIAAQQAIIAALQTDIANLQTQSDQRVAASQAVKIDAVKAVQAAGEARIAALQMNQMVTEAQVMTLQEQIAQLQNKVERITCPLAGLENTLAGVEEEHEYWKRCIAANQFGDPRHSNAVQKEAKFKRILDQLRSTQDELIAFRNDELAAAQLYTSQNPSKCYRHNFYIH